MTKRVTKGVQNIRTSSGRVEQQALPHKAYMRLSILEMEKYRRSKEREGALERVRLIDRRFQDIEAERQEILRMLAEMGLQAPPVGTRAQALPSSGPGPFKICY